MTMMNRRSLLAAGCAAAALSCAPAALLAAAPAVPVDAIRPGMRLPFSPNPDTPVLIYCRTGRRAEYAGEALVASGYRHVYNFLGVTQWPYELVR